MIRFASFVLTASVTALALSTAACGDSSVETTAAELGETQEVAPVAPSALDAAIAAAPDSAWRTVDLENLLRITTNEGVIWVEIAAPFAPAHATRMRELARADWFDFKVFHRVIDGFMAQAGGAIDNPNIAAPTPTLQAEFSIRRDPAALPVSELQERVINPRSNPSRAQAGFWNGFPVGTQPAAVAAIVGDGRVDSWIIHCDGVAAMARTPDPNSANAQFYIVRGEADHLNAQYTAWGKVRVGHEVTYALNEGTIGQGFGFAPSIIEDISVAADLPAEEQPTVQVMDTASEAFAAYLAALGAMPDICEIDVPVRVIN